MYMIWDLICFPTLANRPPTPKHAGLIGPAMWPPAPAILSAAQAHIALQQKVEAVQSRET